VDFSDQKNLPQFDLVRLNHYHKRYLGHLVSCNAEKKSRGKYRDILVRFFKRDIFAGMTDERIKQLCDKIFWAIDTARSVLIWSYPHAFYMQPNSAELRLFEHVQKEVERFLENLTDIVENKPMLAPSEFEQAVMLLIGNTDVLNKHVDKRRS
jgi:hypothetical protein